MSKSVFALAIAIALQASATAVTVPYTDDFAADYANWRPNNPAQFANHVPAGGPDLSAYISGTYNFVGNAPGDPPVVHRANLADSASNNNFFGSWIAADAKGLSAFVRHNAPEPLPYFLRVTGAPAFPGAIVMQPISVLPNTWTEIEFQIDPDSPNLILEGGTFAGIFGNVSRVQFGVLVPAALAGVDQTYTFDLDQVTLAVPEPSAIAMALLGLFSSVFGCGRRRG